MGSGKRSIGQISVDPSWQVSHRAPTKSGRTTAGGGRVAGIVGTAGCALASVLVFVTPGFRAVRRQRRLPSRAFGAFRQDFVEAATPSGLSLRTRMRTTPERDR